MKAMYGVRTDETVWISLGDPTGKTDPHYQFDLMEEGKAKLICDTFARVDALQDSLTQAKRLQSLTIDNEVRWMRKHEGLLKAIGSLRDWKSPDGVLQVKDLRWFKEIEGQILSAMEPT